MCAVDDAESRTSSCVIDMLSKEVDNRRGFFAQECVLSTGSVRRSKVVVAVLGVGFRQLCWIQLHYEWSSGFYITRLSASLIRCPSRLFVYSNYLYSRLTQGNHTATKLLQLGLFYLVYTRAVGSLIQFLFTRQRRSFSII
jgi:hypothetical protein